LTASRGPCASTPTLAACRDIEDPPAGHWYTTVDHINNDSASVIFKGKINYARVVAGSGQANRLTTAGTGTLVLTDLNA
jgi:hypothetical protein